MTQHISKSEKFVREHYPDRITKRLAKLTSVWVEYNRRNNNVLKVIVAIIEDEEKEIGSGMSNIEAWRDAARNIRNNLKQQP